MDGLVMDYNLPGQTTSIDPPGSGTAQTMAYDGVMQDRRTQAGDTTMSYGFAGLTTQATAGGAPHGELFVRDPGGDLYALIDTATSDTRYYLTDKQKSTVATVANSNGQTIRYLYEPYGNQIRSWIDPNAGNSTNDGAENTNLASPTTDYNPWLYASGYLDGRTGLIKFGTRYYLTNAGQFTQEDPKSGNLSEPIRLNGFNYAGSDPVNNSDASGRYWGEDAVDAVAGWDGWDEAYGMATSCVESGLLGAAFGGAFGAYVLPAAAITVPQGAVIGGMYGCAAGMISEGAGYNIFTDPQGVDY